MNIKQDSCSFCAKLRKFKKSIENGDPLSILMLVFVPIILVMVYIKGSEFSVKYYNQFQDDRQFDAITENKPILRCGTVVDDMILPTNYQAFKVGDRPIIRVFYNSESFRDFSPSSCKTIYYTHNIDLDKNRISDTISGLQKEIVELKRELKSKESRIKQLSTENTNILNGYNLPTVSDLEQLYHDFKQTKQPQFEQWIASLKKEETKKLKTILEYGKKSETDCYDDGMSSEAYDAWLEGDCKKVTELMRKQ
jgi:hypothetical protein